MSTYSTLSILNNALTLCGASPVTSLTEDSVNARALNAVFEIARKDILAECKWNFSTTRSTLSTVASTTIAWFYTEEAYVYSRPTDALRIWEVSNQCSIWREEGDYIVSDTAGLGVKYTWDQTDVSKFPSYFVSAFIDKLCSDICFTILNSVPKAESFLAKYLKVSLPKAKSENSQIGTQQQVRDDDWVGTKFANGNPARSYS
jgi:hypothetical protein